jgi:lipopolysaccharide/colanic/teichoic acid biosynthesis glycosyltransferase
VYLTPAVGGWRKRAFDLLASTALLFFFAPLMVLIFIALRGTSRASTIYAHRRVGLDGDEFGCLKFRTMVDDADVRLERLLESDPELSRQWTQGQKLRYDPRVTPIGGFLRALSLDELPQLINVIRGDMSLVGPRPIVREELSRYGELGAALYVRARPGITGLWQTTARGSSDYQQRVELDTYYVNNWTFRGDLEILARTVRVVLSRNGSW